MIDPRVGVDVGGTFTDVVLAGADGGVVTAKVPTTGDQSVGVLDGVRKACAEAGVEPGAVEGFAHGTTAAVNALLERDGARTALVTTAGFRDVLEIGRQDRPALYDLQATKPAPVVPRRRRFEVEERATPEGVETPVDPADVRAVAEDVRACDAESVAVAFLHAYAHPENEARAAALLREELDVPVSASHEVLAAFREYERTATTAADAYVTPVVDDYLARLVDGARDAGLPQPRVMQSNGGVAAASEVREHAVTTVLSGPAAGVIGASEAAGRALADRDLAGVVTFDVGGTSADVSLVRDGEAARTSDASVGGVPLRTRMVDVHTVGSGGGSVAWVDDGGALRVGPESAGASPGPACYGRGGTRPTVTDAAVVLGYLGEDAALGGELELDVDAAEDALAGLAADAGLEDALAAARAVTRVAAANTTQAVREVTVERGRDPRNHGLVAFGGAGPMQAAGVAAALDVEAVVVPLAGGVLSAQGLLVADERYDAVRTHLVGLADADAGAVDDVLADLAADVRERVSDADAATVAHEADLRYVGQSFEQTVPVDGFDAAVWGERFHDAHEAAAGYRMDEPVELVNLRATARVARDRPEPGYEASGDALLGTRTAHFPAGGAGEQAWSARETALYDRRALPAGETVAGPAILEQAESTTVVPPDWTASVRDDGTVVLAEVSADD